MIGEEIKVFSPNKEHKNINSWGEWVIVKGPFAYGIDIPKRDCKCRITYNIDPNQLTPETYEECRFEDIPAKVYKFLAIKVDRDLNKMNQMMENLKHNIEFVSSYKDKIEELRTGESTTPLAKVDYEILEFTPEDEAMERQAEVDRYRSMQKQQENKKVLDNLKKRRNKKK